MNADIGEETNMAKQYSREGLLIAVAIRCAGKSGRCHRQIGIALPNPGRRDVDPILSVTNEGWLIDHGWPILDDNVPRISPAIQES